MLGKDANRDRERIGAGANANVPDDMTAAGRDASELEMIGGIRGRFDDATSTADLAEAAASVPAQLAAGYTAICFKPSMFTDDRDEVGRICERVVAAAAG